jgi:uncharacterized protein
MSEGASVLMSSWPLLIGLGGLSGFLAGLLGIGGGAVIVPALVFALPMLGVDGEALPKIAIATSVAIMIPTAIASAQHHGARGFIDGHSLALFAPSIVLGAFAAGFFAQWINTQLICLLFVLYMLHIARGLARRSSVRMVQVGSRPSLISFTLVGVLGSALSALLGQGSASYAVPFMARFADLRTAIGTAAVLNIPLAAAGGLGYVITAAPAACGTACLGYVHLPAVAAIGISAVLAAPAGALLTQVLPVLLLRRLFALVLAVSAANLAAKTLPLARRRPIWPLPFSACSHRFAKLCRSPPSRRPVLSMPRCGRPIWWPSTARGDSLRLCKGIACRPRRSRRPCPCCAAGWNRRLGSGLNRLPKQKRSPHRSRLRRRPSRRVESAHA